LKEWLNIIYIDKGKKTEKRKIHIDKNVQPLDKFVPDEDKNVQHNNTSNNNTSNNNTSNNISKEEAENIFNYYKQKLKNC
jgi:hypothetical protein